MSKIENVVVTDYIEPDLEWERELLREKGITLEAYQLKGRPEEEVYEKVRSADVIVVNMVKFPASLVDRLDRCGLIIRHGIGYDNIDVDACTRNEIQFAYQPDYCAIDVAEHAISLIMAAARRLPIARQTLEESSAQGEWDFSGLFPLHRMEGKVVGILGVGRIGSIVARKLQSFGFRLLGVDPNRSDEALERLGVEPVDLETLLSQSDYITIHTPLNNETHHLVNRDTLAQMKKTAIIVNTARGPIVDPEALAAALEDGIIAGAAIDVYDVEPPPTSYPLFGQPNAILTPHSAWASVESSWAIRKSIINDILSHADGRDARCVINNVRFKERQVLS